MKTEMDPQLARFVARECADNPRDRALTIADRLCMQLHRPIEDAERTLCYRIANGASFEGVQQWWTNRGRIDAARNEDVRDWDSMQFLSRRDGSRAALASDLGVVAACMPDRITIDAQRILRRGTDGIHRLAEMNGVHTFVPEDPILDAGPCIMIVG